MLGEINLDAKKKTTLTSQIVEAIIAKIDEGTLAKESFLPSLTDFIREYKVAKATVEKAYNVLKDRGYIGSVPGKGYYVRGNVGDKIKVLFILNKISSFKKITYYSFLNKIGEDVIVDLQIHHYKPKLLEGIISHNINRYNYFVIMPHFEVGVSDESYINIIKRIPSNQLLLLDKNIPELSARKVVYQDFSSDIFDALISAKSCMDKYQNIVLMFPEYRNHPIEIIKGVEKYGAEQNKKVNIVYNNVAKMDLTLGTAYIIISDEDLPTVIMKVRKSEFVLGKEVGIISFNESDLKDVLGISVISTDFEKMGETAAELILNNKNEIIRNPFYFIERGSI